MVHVLKGVWISCLLPKVLESFYRRSWGPYPWYSSLITLVKLHDKWGLRLEISSSEVGEGCPTASLPPEHRCG
jgi:hypothetical protein